MRRKKLCASLIPFLGVLPDDVDAAGLLHRLQEWLRGSLADFGGELRELYGLDEYASMDLTRYPLFEAPLEPAVELRRLREVPPTSMGTLAMRVRDVFWEGITVYSACRCPQCTSSDLKILEDALSGELVLCCDLCSWAENARGERVSFSREHQARPIENVRLAEVPGPWLGRR